MNKFIDMTTFVAVVDAKSISEGAKRLGTTKSVVSQRIQQLEKRLGVQLFDRGRQLQITQAGLMFYQSCVSILADLEYAESELVTTKCNLKGRLRLSAPMAFTECYLAPWLAQFASHYPELELDVETTDRYVNLNNENFDAAIRLGRLQNSTLIAKNISVNRHVICASPTYLERAGTPQHPNDLYQHQGLLYILREPNGMLQLPIEGQLQSFRIKNRMRTDSGHQLLAATLDGLGLAILPTFIAAEYIESEALQIVLPAYSPSGGDISVVYRQGKRSSNQIQVLVSFLSDVIGNPPVWDRRIWSQLANIDRLQTQ